MRAVEFVTSYTLAVNLPYVLAIMFVAAEVAWLAREPGARRRAVLQSAATAAGMGGGALVVGVVYTHCGGGRGRRAPERPFPVAADC